MRKIEQKMAAAVAAKKSFSESNTRVEVDDEKTVRVYLFGNCIYRVNADGRRTFTLAGWNTVTTRSRLNALGVNVQQRKKAPYYGEDRISRVHWYEVED